MRRMSVLRRAHMTLDWLVATLTVRSLWYVSLAALATMSTPAPVAALIFSPYATLPVCCATGGLAFHPALNRFIVQSGGVLWRVSADGATVTPFAQDLGLPPLEEAAIAVSTGRGGFPSGNLYLAQGSTIFEIPADGSSVSEFAMLPGGFPSHVALTFDDNATPPLAGALVAVEPDGNVWRINPRGERTLVAAIGFADLFEHAVVAPPTYPTYGRHIITVAEQRGEVRAISPAGEVSTVASGLIDGPESVVILPPRLTTTGVPNGMFAVQFDAFLYRAPASDFRGFENHLAVGTEFPLPPNEGAQLYTLDPAAGFAPMVRGAFPPGFHEGLVFITDTWFVLPNPVNRGLTTEISGAAATMIGSPPTTLADRGVLVSDDDPFNLYDYNFATNAITRFPFTPVGPNGIDDLEGLTYHSRETSYFMTASLSRTRSCQEPEDNRLRLGIFRLGIGGTGNLEVPFYTFRGREEDSLREEFLNRLPFAVQNVARANHPEQWGLNVEALAFVPAAATPFNQDALLFGLRGPLAGPPVPHARCPLPPDAERDRGRAFYFYLLNPSNYIAGDPPDLRGPFSLDLDNRGFRDATMVMTDRGERLLIIAGSVGGPEVGGQERPGVYLFDPRDPNLVNPMSLISISLPLNSEGRAIEAAAALRVGGVERLTLYEDRVPSEAVITALPQ
jgi:hypothetical protein